MQNGMAQEEILGENLEEIHNERIGWAHILHMNVNLWQLQMKES